MNLVRNHVLISIDAGTIMAGARAVEKALVDEISKQGLSGEIAVLETGSIGATGQGVVIVVYPEGLYYANVKPEDAAEIVEEHLLKGRPVKRLMMTEMPKQQVVRKEKTGLMKEQARIVLRNSGVINPENINEYIAAGGYEAIERAFTELKPAGVIKEVKESGLVGRGGAGFATAIKWEFAAHAPGQPKYIICNADEGEPGTFKDRLILEGDPHKLIEGMMLAAYAFGGSKGFIYIRGEYALSIERLEKAIQQAREYGLLGDNILDTGFSFDLAVMKGAGAYVCGEETALIESLEGKRGHPRNKPPYPVTEGLWGKPTVVNNVETLANVPDIVRNGVAWYRGYGTEKCPGTKVYTIIGNVATPGLIEAEMGTTLRDIIYEYAGGIQAGKKFKGALVGGAAGAFLGPEMLDAQMDFVNLKEYAAVLGSGAILVMDEHADIVDMLQSVLHFFKHESCGHCVPCRLGTKQLVEIIDRIAEGKGKTEDIEKMVKISETMRDTSFCPLGQSLVLPISSSLKYFKDEVYGRIPAMV
ncbi:MAG: NADH-quinone oxidoreductase subunit NuoF [Syntrophorhabdaceae bacterium]|nr:NADH-quinone oxidoreductase subunit NuoF [Syntrophorhabdaceae bacterium]MDD4196054.1 NADH-quinone oxidoreductase subunit NuoF [Syntrophorhabdaceae bacterium]HOC45255.1 NADH-quinone oxidoreductase subunit NuoF [Syntrophorhabdaceae bacterium]